MINVWVQLHQILHNELTTQDLVSTEWRCIVNTWIISALSMRWKSDIKPDIICQLSTKTRNCRYIDCTNMYTSNKALKFQVYVPETPADITNNIVLCNNQHSLTN